MLYNENEFTKENLDLYLKEVSKIYKKKSRNMPAELILIGGAAVLANYGFRDMTTVIDAIINASSVMKEAILEVADKYGLTDDWLNFDFRRTDSYSYKLIEHSKYYKTFSNIVQIRLIEAEFLIAMKVMAGRDYKNDRSDIVGIIREERKRGNNITFEMVDYAITELYGGWNNVSDDVILLLKNTLNSDNIDQLFDDTRSTEKIIRAKKLEEWQATSVKEENGINYYADSQDIIRIINDRIVNQS